MYSQNVKRRRALKTLSYGIAFCHVGMGILIINIPRQLSPLFDFAFATFAPWVWGITFLLTGLWILIAHFVPNHKSLFEAHYFSLFIFSAWGIVMILSSLRNYAFTSGYPLVCLIAGLGSKAVADSIAPSPLDKSGDNNG